MKNCRNFLLVMLLTVVLIIFTACGTSAKQSTSDRPATKGALDVDAEISEKTEEQDQVAKQTDQKSSAPNSQITSGEEAVQYLKQQLKEGNDDAITFGTDGKLVTDDNGSYYTIQLVDIQLRVSGKTGNLGYYKVYQDGTYELYQLEVSDTEKEAYIKQLNAIEQEMKELRQNSEATTTLDMEEEEANRYKIWDVELNEIYGVLKEQLSKEQMEKLREAQRNWIKHRDETAKEASLKYEGGSMESLEYVATQATLTKERCYELVSNYLQ
ncbi:lysozyme inhibitor LprI family protein [Aquibacillus sediminis]|uniref:lysozyme inhibitor LprI family protein n=1 Tax=Aquibacillus sediminis TaxID=2574734 RepID=UPI001FE2FC61|nr:lysozyme inhibitor LprI family protein [Aquibacillus sediminis]